MTQEEIERLKIRCRIYNRIYWAIYMHGEKPMTDNVVRSHDTSTCECWMCKKIRIEKGLAAPVSKEDKEP